MHTSHYKMQIINANIQTYTSHHTIQMISKAYKHTCKHVKHTCNIVNSCHVLIDKVLSSD